MIRRFFENDYFYLALIYLVYLCIALSLFRWVIDDLYIYFRYVNNFVDGKGIVYNSGEFVEGFSSFIWFLILTLFKLAGFPLELSSKIAGLFFALLNLLLLYRICIHRNLGKLSLLACCLMMLNLPFILWSISGFEIMFFVFLLLSCFYLLIKLRISITGMITISLLLFLISLTRPEGVLFSVAFAVFTYAVSKNKMFTFKIILFYCILFGSFLAFRYFYFGDLLPNTYYAKIGHNLIGNYEVRSYKNGLFYILYFLKDNPQFLIALFLIFFSFKNILRDKIFLLSTVLILVQSAFIIFAGGDWMVQYRFAVPMIPFISFSAAACIKELNVKHNFSRRFYYSSSAVLLILILFSLFIQDYGIIRKETILWNNVKNLSEEIESGIPVNSLVASGASGIIPYYMQDVKFIDIVGLTNKQIAKNGYRHGTWFERSLPEYVYGLNPGVLIMWKRKGSDGNYTFMSAAPCYHDMSVDPAFAGYELYKVYDVYDDSRIELYKIKEK